MWMYEGLTDMLLNTHPRNVGWEIMIDFTQTFACFLCIQVCMFLLCSMNLGSLALQQHLLNGAGGKPSIVAETHMSA